MDLSTLSDADLLAYRSGDLSRMSDAGIRAIRSATAAAKPQSEGGLADGAYMGLTDPIHGGAQLLVHMLPDSVVRAGNRVNNWLADKGVPLARLPEPTLSGLVTGQGPSSGADAVDQIIRDRERQYEEARAAQGRDGIDWMRLGGNIVNPINLVPGAAAMRGATTAGRVAIGGAVGGAVSAATQPVTTENDFAGEKSLQIGAGGLGGAIMSPIMAKAAERLGAAASEAWARTRPLSETSLRSAVDDVMTRWQQAERANGIDLGQLPKSVLASIETDVRDALRLGKTLDPAALLRKADFEAVGIKPTRGQISRDPTQYTRERNLAATEAGAPLKDRFADQSAQFRQHLSGLAGPEPLDAYPAGTRLIGMLEGVDAPRRAGVSAAYGGAKSMIGRETNLPATSLAQRYGEVLDEYGADVIPSAVRMRLESYGLRGGQQSKLLTVEEAERTIQTINRHYDPSNQVQARALNELRQGLQDSIDGLADAGSQIGQDAASAFRGARTAARDRFRQIEGTPALKAAVEGADPDRFVERYLIRAKTNDLKALGEQIKDVPGGRDLLRSQLAQHLRKAAFGHDLSEDAPLNHNGLTRALSSLGREKLSIFFSPEEVAHLNTLARVGSHINQRPAGSAVNESNTAGALNNLLAKIGSAAVTNTPVIREGWALAAMARKAAQTDRQINDALFPMTSAAFPGRTRPQNVLADVAMGTPGVAGYWAGELGQ